MFYYQVVLYFSFLENNFILQCKPIIKVTVFKKRDKHSYNIHQCTFIFFIEETIINTKLQQSCTPLHTMVLKQTKPQFVKYSILI